LPTNARPAFSAASIQAHKNLIGTGPATPL